MSWEFWSPEVRRPLGAHQSCVGPAGWVSCRSNGGGPAESTTGSLYAYGRSLTNLSPLFLSPLVEFSG